MEKIYKDLNDILQTIIRYSDLDELFSLEKIENRTDPNAPNVKQNVSKSNNYNINAFEVYFKEKGYFKFRLYINANKFNLELKNQLEKINGCISTCKSYIDYGQKFDYDIDVKELVKIDKYISIAKEIKHVLDKFDKKK